MADLNTDNTYPLGPIVGRRDDGSVAALDASVIPTWASSDETVVTVLASADGMSAVLTTVAPNQKDTAGAPIPVRVTVTGVDADPGPGTVPLIGTTEDIFVTLGPKSFATKIEIPVGAPVPK